MSHPAPAFFYSLVARPDLSATLVLVGILLWYAELNRPGTVLPAVFGTLSSTLGVYALAQHPINPAALAMLPVALLLLLADIRLKAANFFAFLSMLILIASLEMLFRRGQQIHPVVAGMVSITFVLFSSWLGRIALKARRNKRLIGPQVQSSNPNPYSAVLTRRVD